ncbi:MAG: hypothetical protein R3Y13_03650 [bacterium]
MNKKIQMLSNLFDNNKLSHAVLIETNNQNFCIEEMFPLIKKMSCISNCENSEEICSICRSIENKEGINFHIIEPDGKNIKKEQLIHLMDQCITIPVLSKNHVYIIKGAECLNSSSANTMLKFVEEPNDSCYGFFITNNKENIINTIRSRCEIYTVNYEEASLEEKFNITKEEFEVYIKDINLYLKEILDTKDIIVNKELLNEKYKDRYNLSTFFSIILDILDNYINVSFESVNGLYTDFSYLSEFSVHSLMCRKKIIINILNNIGYNLNIDLLLDKFIIEMSEIDE